MEYKDYYAVLGVGRDAAASEVKAAFRRLARRYHPDVSKERDAEARMKEVNEAHEVLSDPEKRAAYDALGRNHRAGEAFRPPPDWDVGFEFSGLGSTSDAADFSDFFAEFFGRDRGAAKPRRAGRGEDHHAKVLVDLEDVFCGATRQIVLRVPRTDPHGRMRLEERTLNLQIPRGLRGGQILRLAGQGAAAPDEGLAGDLLLEVNLRPHPRFRIDGCDLLTTVPVAPWEAALGAVIDLPMPDGGTLKVRIPEGAQSGQQLRVRGHGIPASTPGDLRLDLQVVLPPAATPRARQIYETMARELGFDPRAATQE